MTIVLEVVHLLEDLLVVGKICLGVICLVLPFVLEGVQLLLSLVLGKTWSKKCVLEFLESSTDIMGLVELVDAGLSRVLHNNNEFSLTFCRINGILGRSEVMHFFVQLGVSPAKVDPMLLDGDDGGALDHHLVRYCLVLVHEGDNMGMEHVGTWGLVCSTKGLKILTDVCEGLLRVCSIPLGSVHAVEVVVVITLLCPLKVHVVNISLVNEVETWIKITLDMVEQDEAHQNQSMVCKMANANAWVSLSIFMHSTWGT